MKNIRDLPFQLQPGQPLLILLFSFCPPDIPCRFGCRFLIAADLTDLVTENPGFHRLQQKVIHLIFLHVRNHQIVDK